MSLGPGTADLRRRLDRRWLRIHARLDGEAADRALPWVAAAVVFCLHVGLTAAAIRSGTAGGGLGPWIQAAWSRRTGTGVQPVGGVDPSLGGASVVGELASHASRLVPDTAVFTLIQSAAIALAVIPLWRLARQQASLRVGATTVVVVAYGLAPTLHQAALTPFHPELVAVPALLGAWLNATRGRWTGYWLLVVLALASRGDVAAVVAVMGAVVAIQFNRRQGTATALVATGWLSAAHLWVSASAPATELTPAGEFVARAVGPLGALSALTSDPWGELTGLVSQPSLRFLVVVLAPVLFMPLVSLRRFAPALAVLALAMMADRPVARSASTRVLDLAPAAAHVSPALAFTFVALVCTLERIGIRSVVKVNVDRRVLVALLCATSLFFLVDSPSAPYHRPWDWGGRGYQAQVRDRLAGRVPPLASIATSPSATALVARRPIVVELPPTPGDLGPERIETLEGAVEWVLLDTSVLDPRSGDPEWRPVDVAVVLSRLRRVGFEVEARDRGVILLSAS